MKFGPVVQEEMSFKGFKGHYEEQFCEIILNLDQWFSRRSHLKIFLIGSSGGPLFSGGEPFVQIWRRAL